MASFTEDTEERNTLDAAPSARRPGLVAWWAAPDALACSRGGLPPWLRGGELVCLLATSLCCFPAHVGARQRGDLAVGRRRPRGGESYRGRPFVGNSFFLADRGDKTAGIRPNPTSVTQSKTLILVSWTV
jgi:hypothetical protein